ncbi:serine protease snake-like [Anopheles ziemanni]|uniref:serine protease snake-like n=1 Tax=Anopheles coustani TaxID=139045 RepID=UPI00265AA572|nr:serine protease snake-like [Anopheles coustani]XP_058169283.1 serine protease snake-like [Anopheles ziemanni]
MLIQKKVSFLTVLLGVVVFSFCAVSGKRISELKCDAYKEIISSTSGIMTLNMNPMALYYKVQNCSNVVDLIVGGERAVYGEYPHHAILGFPQDDGSYSFMCGGSLISNRFILTAAHCFSFVNATLVRLGVYDLAENSVNQVDFGIAEIIRHPNYSNSLAYHDIALLRLNETVLFSKFIRPACLWTEPVLNTSSFIATGFGKLGEGTVELSSYMMKVKLDLFPSAECQRKYEHTRKLRHGMSNGQLCVGSIVGGKDTCQGDSGGPLQVITEPRSCIYNIVGVTSTGTACGVGNSIAIYTNVAFYLDWIEKIVWPQ